MKHAHADRLALRVQRPHGTPRILVDADLGSDTWLAAGSDQQHSAAPYSENHPDLTIVMPSDFVPSSPSNDVARWAAQASRSDEGLLTPDLVALAQSGVAIGVACRMADGRPIVGTGIGCRIDPDGTMRILLGRTANAGLVAALAQGSGIAATFTGAPDHRAFQVKAGQVELREALPEDLAEVDRQCAVLADGLVEIGFSRELASGYVAHDPDDLTVLAFRPERIFTQTPGPGAGAELRR